MRRGYYRETVAQALEQSEPNFLSLTADVHDRIPKKLFELRTEYAFDV